MALATLYPASNGTTNQNVPVGSANAWDCVNETPHNSDTDYLENQAAINNDYIDLFTIQANSIPSGAAISSVKVYYVHRITGSGKIIPNAKRRISIRENSTTTTEPTGITNNSQVYTLNSYEWTTRPSDGGAWTKADIDSLEIGFALNTLGGTSKPRVTQVYVEVTYSAPSGPGPRTYGFMIG